MKNYFNSINQLKGEGTIWGVAFRKRSETCLYEGNRSAFTFIRNSFRYWLADPFLFDYEGKTYLFVEMYDRIKAKGIIGCAIIRNGKCGRFKKCLDIPYHLSYPCVFRHQNDIFMVPECARSGKITVYKSVKFPYEWREEYVLYEGEGVDTTPVLQNDADELLFLTTLKTEKNRKNNCLYAVSRNQTEKLLIENDDTVRSAGHLIRKNNDLLRPAQDCTQSYGGALIFKRILACTADAFCEENFARIEADEIEVNNSQYAFNGIHTYNQSEKYEVIDLSYDVGKSLPYLIKKIRKHFIQA